MLKAFLIGFAVATCLIVDSCPALSHDEAAWIMANPDFKRRNGTVHCCGVRDCERMPPEVIAELKSIEGGWELRGAIFLYGRSGMYHASSGELEKDQSWWWCRSDPTARPFCLFEPQFGL